mgnify:FL=1
MGSVNRKPINVEALKRIPVAGGDILHILKCSEPDFSGFGEAYFSWIDPGAVKAWRYHKRMTLNLAVPVGKVRFAFLLPDNSFRIEDIGDENYVRLNVPPGIWFGFQGRGEGRSLIVNVANIPHDPDEMERKLPNEILFDWSEP